MSFLVGDIARARLSHDLRQHLEQEQEAIESEIGGDGAGYNDEGILGGKQTPEADNDNNEDPCLAYLVEYDPGTDPEMCSVRIVTPAELLAVITTRQDRVGVADRRGLLVLQGLSAEYVQCLVDIKELDIDPAFLDAHAERRGYRPTGRWKGGKPLRVECWEYPELVQGFGPEAESYLGRRADVVNGMRSPAVHPIGHKGLAAVFCRVALWVSEGFPPIVFVERPIWDCRGSPLSKARRGTCATSPRCGEGPRQGIEIQSLDDRIRELLADFQSTESCGNIMLEDASYNAWLGLFEMLDPPAAEHTTREATASLYWRIMQALEQNKTATSVGRYSQTRVEWGELLSQVHWRVSLLATTAIPSSRKLALTPASTRIFASGPKLNTLGGNGTLPPGRIPGRTDRGVLDDENHRALDRISYLGGILIPLPIVSGILSMGDTFGPDGPKFWIFWAASIPLSILAVFIIYADTIRKAEVWVEVAAEHVAAVSPSTDVQTVQEDDEKTSASWRRRNRRGVRQDVEAQVALAGQTRASGAAAETPPVEAAGLDEEGGIIPVLVGLAPEQLGVEAPPTPDMILEESTHGRKPKAWKRQKLGWYGAARAIVYPRQKPRYCTHEAPQGVAAYDKRRRKTETSSY